MESYIVLKILSRLSDGYLVLLKSIKTSEKITVRGNIPYFPSGMTVNFSISGNYITDYDYVFSQRNASILNRNLIDLDTFLAKIKLQKKKGFHWEEMYDIENPYSMYDFPIADNIAHEIGLKKTCPQRITYMSRYVRDKIRSKNIEKASLENMINAYERIEKDSPYDDLTFTQTMEIILDDKNYRLERNRFVDVEIERANLFIDNNIFKREQDAYSSIDKSDVDEFLKSNHTLDDKQREAVFELCNNKISVICGNAGTGKTFTIKTILDCYSSFRDRNEILCLAPTGKASRRITEESGYPAQTIHSALKITPTADFCYFTQENPLPYKLIIVDESSMIDTLLMYRLLNACDYTTKLIFVGDDKQLPPVGCGRPFEKFLAECSVVKLDKIFRQDENSGILKNAYKAYKEGFKNLNEYDDFHISYISSDDIENVVKKYSDAQLIVPYNDLRKRINHFVQKNDTNFRFVVGDKVVALKNTENYCNGDIGYVKKIYDRKMVITMPDSENPLQNKDIIVTKEFFHHFDLAYALTVHKMQGSEADNIVVFLPKEENRFITGAMLYTAFTRAKNSVQIYYYA